MYLPIVFVALVLCMRSRAESKDGFGVLDDDSPIYKRSITNNDRRMYRRSSMIALGKAVVAKLCQTATKFERHSSETVTKYGKSGGWAAAKADFREVTKHADRNSVRMKADPSGRNVVEMSARVGDRHIHLLRDGYNGHPTLQVTDHLVHKNHVDEFIYSP